MLIHFKITKERTYFVLLVSKVSNILKVSFMNHWEKCSPLSEAYMQLRSLLAYRENPTFNSITIKYDLSNLLYHQLVGHIYF